ncbi:hypothetical protein [Streptomyces griseoloalbus]|uniref:hypothetical protein n=1 Tax=Streptomyces griseoloalbus TaxID=67303 RepID=UPI003F540E2F
MPVAALETGRLVAPADGPVSWTAHADLAEAAAVVLAVEGGFEGATPLPSFLLEEVAATG